MATKEYGDGSVYQTSSKRWRGKLNINGKTKYFSGKTEKEVKRKMRDFRNDPLNFSGAKVADADTAEYFQKWMTQYKQPTLKVSSYDRLDGVLRNYIKPEFEGISIGDVTPDQCNDLIKKLKDKGLSHSTVKKVYDTLNECFRHAVNRREIQYSPMLTVSMPKKANFTHKKPQEARFLTEDEVTRFIEEANRTTISTQKPIYRYRDAFILDLHTGMREGELIALDWNDIDFKKNEIKVHKTAVMVQTRDKEGNMISGTSQIIQESPKTSKSTRTLPMNKAAKAALQRLKEQAGKSEFVLPTQTGARLVLSSFRKQYGIIANHAGIEGSSLHSIRHTFATRLFERGADVKDVSTLLGHSSVGITYNTYIHVIKERKNDVVSLLDDKEDATKEE